MRKAIDWAKMYRDQVSCLSIEELEAFVAAIQLEAITAMARGALSSEDYKDVRKHAGKYPEDLFI